MPRVHHVQKARKAKKARACRRCGHKIQPGEPYKWAEPRYGPIMLWCKDHSPKRSELSSSKLGPVWDAVDDFDPSGAENGDDLQSLVQEVADVAREVAEEYEESIGAMPDNLQDTSPIAEEMRDNVDKLNSFADDLEQWSPDEEEGIEEQRESAEEAINECPL